MPLLQRNISERFKFLLSHFPAVAIIGPRQVGKTTLAKTVAKGFKYFDLENPSDFQRINADPVFFFSQQSSPLILDEAQLCLDIFPVLRGVIDQKRDECGRFVLTGSSSPTLIKGLAESLAGRIAIIELETLMTNEIFSLPLSPLYKALIESDIDITTLESHTPIPNDQLNEAWLKGGYPEPISKKAEAYDEWMGFYQSTYLHRDVMKLFPRLNDIAYQRFINILAHTSGQLINKAEIARSIGVSEKTINDYFDIAHGTFLWRKVPSYENDLTKSVVKMPRGHYRDSGLLNYLLKINTIDSLYSHPRSGLLFESWVIEELHKGIFSQHNTNIDLYYYRSRGGAEVDCIVDGPNGLIPIEIKMGTQVKKQQLKNLGDFISKHSCSFGLLISHSQHLGWLTPKILEVPVNWL